jgi:subtilase family serine protease
VPGLAAGATSAGLVTVTIPSSTPLNTYSLLVCADDLNAVAESNEGNNCIVASSGTVTVTRPDLAEITVTMTPASPIRAPGTTFSVTDTTQNFGAASGPSTTRYYLSLDVTKNAGDTLLTGSRAVPGLTTYATNSGTVTVTIPSSTPVNTYFLLACADDLNVMAEINETNNCNLAVSGTVTVARPDLVETGAITTPAAPVRAPGTTFSVTDTARNSGAVAAGASTTRYYLSLDGVKNAGDTLLTGSRSVPGLAAGATHAGTVTVTIPQAIPLNTYVLLACADDLNTVVETNDGNNCVVASSGSVTVTRPDLLGDAISNPPTTKARGTTFSVTDTTRNGGTVASGASTTRYYLSLDGLKNAGDTLLTGNRPVPGLAAGASSSGTITVTIPSGTPLNTYFLLACADDLSTVVETTETNNCKASATGVTVTP